MKKLFLVVLMLAGCGQGPAGVPGSRGSGCTVSQIQPNINAPEGGALVSCTDGTSSLILSGTVLKPIQFCPSTPSYPAVFPEIGFLVDGKIYAVYSLNNGFLALMTPGRYTSNAVGSICDFTINNDYTITY